MPATSLTYSIACPKCGAQLQPVALDPQTAPWLCSGCNLGFWASELTTDSRKLFDPQLGGRQSSLASHALHAQCVSEAGEAFTRGTSLRPDQLGHAHRADLQRLVNQPGLDPTFVTDLETAIANRNAPKPVTPPINPVAGGK